MEAGEALGPGGRPLGPSAHPACSGPEPLAASAPDAAGPGDGRKPLTSAVRGPTWRWGALPGDGSPGEQEAGRGRGHCGSRRAQGRRRAFPLSGGCSPCAAWREIPRPLLFPGGERAPRRPHLSSRSRGRAHLLPRAGLSRGRQRPPPPACCSSRVCGRRRVREKGGGRTSHRGSTPAPAPLPRH